MTEKLVNEKAKTKDSKKEYWLESDFDSFELTDVIKEFNNGKTNF